ncbi:MAG: glutamate-5-semialdehyde dehydrogenase [Pseudomonadota bacterium]
MTIQEKNLTAESIASTMVRTLAKQARAVLPQLAQLDAETKAAGLNAAAASLLKNEAKILAANAEDMAAARSAGIAASMLDRLALTPERLAGIAEAVQAIAALPDPVGTELARWDRPNGLDIARVRVPIGVIGVIYESRPNVTVDAAALCLKAGNAVILRGGKESLATAQALHAAFCGGLADVGIPAQAIGLVETRDRAAVTTMLTEPDLFDMVVPRGGKSLVAKVQSEARVPVIAHLEGLCHVYIDKAADLAMAKDITVNAKMRRPGICGAAETLLIDAAILSDAIPVLEALAQSGCEIRGDADVRAAFASAKPASETDWRTEYLEPIISVRAVEGLDGAVQHIATYSSGHTDAIVTEDVTACTTFLNAVDSAIVMHNASTQFADGGEFGMGAEIGISTGRLHARGPVGVEQLTTFKYVVRGSGQTRP